MATSKQQVLQLKEWSGVDRFTEGTAQKPDAFEIIQNYYATNPGEIKSLNGVTQLNSSSLVGVEKVIHSKFIDTATSKGLFLLCDPTGGPWSADSMSGATFDTNGSGFLYDVYIQGIGAGTRNATKYSLPTRAEAAQIVITLPTVTRKTRSINIWIKANSDTGGATIAWCGSVYRKADGTFPTTITVRPPKYTNVAAPADLVGTACPNGLSVLDYSVGAFNAEQATGGRLEPGRMYYFGISPWYKVDYNQLPTVASCPLHITGADVAAQKVMSAYLNDGNSKFTLTFDFLPYNPMKVGGTSTPNTYLSMDFAAVHMGLTPEDLMPVGTVDGISTVQSVTRVTSSSGAVSATDTAPDPDVPAKFTISGYSGPVGSLIKLISKTCASTDLVANDSYYVTSSVLTSDGSIVTLAKTEGGASVVVNVAGAAVFAWAKVVCTVLHLPHSMNVMPVMGKLVNECPVPKAGTGRSYALFRPHYFSQQFFSFNAPDSENPIERVFGIYYKDSTLNDSLRRDLFQPFWQPAVNLSNTPNWENTASSYTSIGDMWMYSFRLSTNDCQSRLFGNRMWMANGFNEPFYTNGHLLKSGCPTSESGTENYQRWPITKFIEFFKNSMILANDTQNQTYDSSSFYYSNPTFGDIANFNATATATRTLPINSGDQSTVRGLNIYSQDLTSVGAESFLVVWKKSSLFVWNGDPASNPKLISKATGLAGPNSYCLTKFGPVFVGTDNVYLFKTSQDVTPIGNNIKDVIKGLSDAQLYQVNCVYHDEDVKLGYSSDVNIDSEFWLRLIQIQGGVNAIWTGPHLMEPYQLQTQIPFWGSEREYRVSVLDTDLFRRDDPGSFLNAGQDIVRRLKIRNLGLQSDQLLKLIQGLNLHLRVVESEDFTLTLEAEDGSPAMVVSFTVNSAGNIRMFKQVQIPQRFLGRVLTLSLENTNNSDMSIYDFSLLFSVIKRRLLP